MTYPAVPTPVTRRERQIELNPLRYHPMVSPVQIPEPVQVEPQPRRLGRPLIAIGIVSGVIAGIAWAVAHAPLTALFP
ncbi:hypothetical protein [Mycetocola sp.]|uniref:hypothetical protein n=1 Tax=Mycetocola sp. TaxID=1871042 RepID=UPI0039891A1E